MKKIYLNFIFQFFAIMLIVSIFIFNDLDLKKILVFIQTKVIFLFLLIFSIKLFAAFLFYKIIEITTNKKNSFLEISNTFIQGGIVNQLVPGAGLLFKYYKFKIVSNISLAQYSTSQIIFTLISIICYFFLSVIFGFVNFIELNLINFLIFVGILFSSGLISIILKNKIINTVKKSIINIKSISFVINDLIKIKNLIKNSIKRLIIISLLILTKCFFECIAFYYAIIIYDTPTSFVESAYLYLSSFLITLITLMNFVGIFEIILTLSASLISNNYIDILFVGLGFNILNNLSLFLIIIVIFFIKFVKKFSKI